MRRLRGKGWRRLRLTTAAVAALLLGYYLGHLYQVDRLEEAGLRMLDAPRVLTNLPAPLRRALEGHWSLLLAGEPGGACDNLLRHYIQVYNRIADHPRLQRRLRLVLLSAWPPAEESPWRLYDWAGVHVLPASQRQALLEEAGLGDALRTRPCTSAAGTTALLLDPQARLLGTLPLDKPARMAESLRLVFDSLDSMKDDTTPGLGDRLSTALLRVLPQHLLSAGMYRLARSETPWLKNALIRYVLGHYDVDMSEAAIEDPYAYPSFNAFFTRALKPDARPIAPEGLASPADGKVSQAGRIRHDRLLQAKGHEYSLYALLAGDGDLASQFESGSFATIYLSPRDYHRVHMPLDGTLREMVFVPGDLFSVSEATAQLVPGLFARNERVILHFDTPRGPMAVILVGAIFVGSMQTVWHGEVRADELKRWRYEGDEAPRYARGEEIARFNMGSTVIVLNTQHAVDLLDDLPGRRVRMGEKIGD